MNLDAFLHFMFKPCIVNVNIFVFKWCSITLGGVCAIAIYILAITIDWSVRIMVAKSIGLFLANCPIGLNCYLLSGYGGVCYRFNRV